MESNMKRLIDSVQEAVAYAKGDKAKGRSKKYKIPSPLALPELDPKQVRTHLHLSQAEFASRFGFNLHTLRNWEHGRRHPDQAVLAYLYAILKHPDLVEKALRD
jgi:putative transcriptional regulator